MTSRIAIVGAGAVGCYFGGLMARGGLPVTLIGRAKHIDAIRERGLLLDKEGARDTIAIEASTELADARDADLVLVSVKTLDTEVTARALAGILRPDAQVVSLQNGVDNAERMRAAGVNAESAVVYVGCYMGGPGHVVHTGRGELAVGPALRDAAALIESAGVPCRVTASIETELWQKLILNCAYNAISALTFARYGRMVEFEETREMLCRAVEETVAVAKAIGITFERDMMAAALALGGAMPGTLSSTGQDLQLGRKTEIDSLNGYVARRGRELNVPTPVNAMLRALVKLREEAALPA